MLAGRGAHARSLQHNCCAVIVNVRTADNDGSGMQSHSTLIHATDSAPITATYGTPTPATYGTPVLATHELPRRNYQQ